MKPQKTLNSQRNPKRGEKNQEGGITFNSEASCCHRYQLDVKKVQFCFETKYGWDFVPLKQFW